ncbi:uncharacterized protein LOC130636543 [Hydractinia symbiolongicarpus]|uniref:uncharacterized protein LOC130636543 n=1 Tax=Hydractinia symbiolongicarpus TaxID=13093 RepID=UPI00254BC084|nr:uncharacterized protein LOC130636543 [Hydractinia symbiolongicarpus]
MNNVLSRGVEGHKYLVSIKKVKLNNFFYKEVNKMKSGIAFLLLLVAGCLTEEESTCRDSVSFCSHMKLTCKYFSKTKELCQRTCGTCSVDCSRTESNTRQQCGTSATTKDQCLNLGCCWKPLDDNTNTPWCFKA